VFKGLTQSAGTDTCFLLLPLPQVVPQFKLFDVTLRECSIGSIPE